MKKILLISLGVVLLISLVGASINYVINNDTIFSVSSGDPSYVLGDFGIGTASPSSKLDVQGDFKVNGSAFFVNSSNGFVGIGIANPVFPLDVRGIVSISAGSARIELEDILVNGSDWWILPSTGGTTDQFRIYDRGEDADRLIIDSSGRVGIGTTSPTQKLDVNGGVNVVGSLNVTGNYIINGNIGFTGSCVNITYSGGIAVSCND